MNDRAWLETLFARNWWAYDAADPGGYFEAYHWYNLVECSVWLGCAVYVLVRFARFRRGSVELLYALAFVSFGISDFREAWSLDSWLVWLKAANLAALLLLRRAVMSRHYPGARIL